MGQLTLNPNNPSADFHHCSPIKIFSLSGNLTKYIHKDFENSAKGSKRYWHTRNIEPIKCITYWLGATNFYDAVIEAGDAIVEQGITELKIWADEDIGNIWLSERLHNFIMVGLFVLVIFSLLTNFYIGKQ